MLRKGRTLKLIRGKVLGPGRQGDAPSTSGNLLLGLRTFLYMGGVDGR